MDPSHHARKRPRSRASTSSLQSATTQPNLEQSFADTWMTANLPTGVPATMNSQPHPQQRELVPAPHQMTPEESLLLASHLQAGRDFSLEAPVNMTVTGGPMHPAPFHNHHASHSMSRQSLSAESFAGNASFADDSQMMDRDGNEDGDSFAGMPGGARTGSRSSANNETEMRQLFTANKHRSLGDVAEELHGNERGPNSERTRQIFAMLWINQVCSKGKGSVPRGRVYANYASRCAAERITVLNPASFGKLVRVLFPGLKTRRLGVRGESKYHYVNFALREEQPELRDQPLHPMPMGESASFAQTHNSVPSAATSVRIERQSFAVSEPPRQPSQQQAGRSLGFGHSLYNQPVVTSIEQLQSTTTKTAQPMAFESEAEQAFSQSDPLILPAIEAFLPAGTDPDSAMSLAALYRSHCTSLVECIRYCKEKTFFHLYTSFQGTLTMPVQKLFGNPAIAPWIEQCDFVLYQRMMRIIYGLTLQVVPKPVLDTLRNISGRLVPHIRESFQGQPHHVVRAKEAPATIFAGLLDRALRVNLTAHAAANMLSNPANRDLMYTEWMSTINVRKVAECVPTRGMDDLVNLLLSEMRDLLDPANVPWEIECLSLHGEMAMRTGRPSKSRRSDDTSASNVLDRWVSFLKSLPSHFPYASHTDIVWCVQRVGTAIMRDLTIAQGKSFGSWWVTKCWVDEMIQLMAEQGGFMKQKMSNQAPLLPSKRESTTRNNSNQGSRYSSGSDDFNMSTLSQSQPDRAQFPPAPSTGNNNPDDSGIGIRTPDEERSPMDKFTGFTPINNGDFLEGVDFQDTAVQA